jgi:[ribosomal protein S5]-alanine N-acetyltransferase
MNLPSNAVTLRPLEEDDIDERYVAWFRDPEVTRFLDAQGISLEDALEYLREGRRTGRYRQLAICVDGTHVGNVKIGPIQARHGVSDLVTVVGSRAHWGRGVASAAIRLAVGIAFDGMELRKLSASIDSLNAGSLAAYIRAGFAIEGRLPQQFIHRAPDGSIKYSDKIHVGIFNQRYV